MAENTHNSGMGALNAGVLGVVIGAAGAVAAIALSDKENRQKVSKTLVDVKDQTLTKVDQIKGGAQSMKAKVQKKLGDASETVATKKRETKKQLEASKI